MCQRFKVFVCYMGLQRALFQKRANGGGPRTLGPARASRGRTLKSNRRRGTVKLKRNYRSLPLTGTLRPEPSLSLPRLPQHALLSGTQIPL